MSTPQKTPGGRRSNKEPGDIWAGNPYPAGHPKNLEVAEGFKREQRKKLNSRFAGSPMKLRLADYEREKVTWEAAQAASPQRAFETESVVPTTNKIKEFASKSRCMVVVQGGATLWSGEEDGNIVIRNGFTGEISKVLHMRPASEGDHPEVVPDRMMAFGCHIFVGFSDGQIKVFDSLVVTQMQECNAHLGSSVKHFAQLANGRVVAASEKGGVTLFDELDAAASTFPELMTGSVDVGVSSLTACGNDILIGTTKGEILAVDTTDLGAYMRFFVSGEESEDCVVSALVCANGFIFAGAANGEVKVYKLNDRQKDKLPVHVKDIPYHNGEAITSFTFDARSDRIWSTDATGKTKAWDARLDTEFVLRLEVAGVEGEVVDVAMQCHMDAMRLWTLAANGINFSWWTEFDRAGHEMENAVKAMQEIIDRDQDEIDQWKKNVAAVERADKLRSLRCLEALATLTDNALRQTVYWRWRKWLKLREHLNKRQAFAESLAASTEYGLMRIYYARLFSNWQSNRVTRQKLAVAQNLMCTTRKGMQRVYWRKMLEYTRKEKAKLKRLQMAEALLSSSATGLMRVAFKKWCSFNDRRKNRRKRIQISETLLRNSDAGLQRLYYFKFVRFLTGVRAEKKRSAVLETMGRNSDLGLLRIYYGKLVRNLRVQAAHRQRQRLAELMMANTDRGLTALYYRRWTDNAAAGAATRRDQEYEENQRTLAELEEKYKGMEGRIERQKALQAKMDERDALVRQKMERLARIAELEASLRSLEERIRNKEDREAREASIRAQLVETMSQLKCRALNFDSDYSLICKTVDRAASVDRGALRAFLSAHMDLKRVVVAQLGEQPSKKRDSSEDVDLTYTWGKTDTSVRAAVAKFPTHSHSSLLESIKKMVITFDILQPAELNDIETDDEIVANANGLIVMFDYIADQRAKRRR
eukprot:PhM_4_TR4964/c0_g1_i1/m.56959